MTGVPVQVCVACGHAAFPARLACPACGARNLRRESARSGIVEERTTRRATSRPTPTLVPDGKPAEIASVRTRLGPVLIAWSRSRAAPGSEVELTLERGIPVATAPGVPPHGVLPTLEPAQRTIPELLQLRASQLGDSPCLEIGDRRLTFAGLRDAVARHAGALAGAGIVPGDRVAVMASNSWELLVTFLGAAWLGAIAVPVNPAARGAQLAYVLGDASPRLLAIDRGLLDELDALAVPPSELERIWTLGSPGAERWRGIPCERFPNSDSSTGVEPNPAWPGQIAALLYTSGTTGPAKGVCCPQAQFTWWGENVGRMLELRSEDVLYTCLPLFHVNALGTVMQGLIHACRVIVGPRFSASQFWEQVAASGATVTYLLGALVSILARTAPHPTERAHQVRVALAPATAPELEDVFRERFGVRLVDAFGMTEANAVIGPESGRRRRGTMGRPLPGYRARVVDEADVEVPDGTPGQLVLRADDPYAFATGYWRLPEQTVAAWRNLWLHTGDLVVRDPDGSFRFVDRVKDAIRRRGENISAWEVEQVLLSHPDVAAAAVVAVPSELGEDEVLAVVVPREGIDIDPRDIVRHCEGKIAAFAVPRYVELLPELPLTENGKVRKHVLRERGVTATTWDRDGMGV
jgi:crotonobetaine/carnitine-CoA ligase